ncbi:MAG: flagellar motor stator protein MotA [Bdellovibrionales bacterium]|nr:flagellar motor stator protein MotA [Bdellovibrionales bacterium]
MLIIIGGIFVCACVFGAFAGHGGNLAVLWQPVEVIIIVGAGIGATVISSSPAVLKEIIGQIKHALTGKPPSKAEYTDALLLMYEIIKTAKGNPLSLEAHVEKPEASEIFKRYPSVVKNHHVLHFLCDTLKVQISAPMSPYDLEDLMDKDIDAIHAAEMKAATQIGKFGDAMPGLGIVAAVLGIVQTMGKLSMGKEVIGHSVAAALVGTFLGILVSYGFAGPIAARVELMINDSGGMFNAVKVALLAYAKDCSPKVCVEFARRSIPPEVRPSFEEIDKATSGAGKGGGAAAA